MGILAFEALQLRAEKRREQRERAAAEKQAERDGRAAKLVDVPQLQAERAAVSEKIAAINAQFDDEQRRLEERRQAALKPFADQQAECDCQLKDDAEARHFLQDEYPPENVARVHRPLASRLETNRNIVA